MYVCVYSTNVFEENKKFIFSHFFHNFRNYPVKITVFHVWEEVMDYVVSLLAKISFCHFFHWDNYSYTGHVKHFTTIQQWSTSACQWGAQTRIHKCTHLWVVGFISKMLIFHKQRGQQMTLSIIMRSPWKEVKILSGSDHPTLFTADEKACWLL